MGPPLDSRVPDLGPPEGGAAGTGAGGSGVAGGAEVVAAGTGGRATSALGSGIGDLEGGGW